MTDLQASYAACQEVNSAYGRTYYLATRMLPAWKRPSVHALYAFARVADDLVDVTGESLDKVWDSPVIPAFQDTLARWEIPQSYVDAFLHSMRMDLTTTSYDTDEDLQEYVWGSAAVIGLQMLPILEPVVPREVAAPYAADLGVAFQLTNFLRDVGEDLDRGRLYLPLVDLDRFGVSREDLEARVLTPRIRELLAFEVAKTRALYVTATQGVRLLHPSSRPCIETALALYGGILREIEREDFPVLTRRVSVGLGRRARVALPALVSARRLAVTSTG